MLKQTERELAQLKRQKATKIQQNKVRNNNSKPTRGGRGGRGGGRGAGRGAGRGGASRGQKPKSADALDAELDGYMLGTKGGLDQELDAYMSSTKVLFSSLNRGYLEHCGNSLYFQNGLDKQMEEYMAAKNSA